MRLHCCTNTTAFGLRDLMDAEGRPPVLGSGCRRAGSHRLGNIGGDSAGAAHGRSRWEYRPTRLHRCSNQQIFGLRGLPDV